jgi:DnaJ-domain-containing protein 1
MVEMTNGARRAIYIAEKIFPNDLARQRDLARDIIDAINLCESEFAQEIIQRMRVEPRPAVGHVSTPEAKP